MLLPSLKTSLSLLAIILTAAFGSTLVLAAPSPDQIAELFLPAEFAEPKISPDGASIGFMVRHGDDYGIGLFTFATGRFNTVATQGIVPVGFWWKANRQLLVETTTSDQNARGYTLINIDSGKSEDLWRLVNAGGKIIDALPEEPRNVMILSGDLLGRANVDTGHVTTLSPLARGACYFDNHRRFRASFSRASDGSARFRWRDTNSDEWHSQEFAVGESDYSPIGFDDDPRFLWLLDGSLRGEAVISRFDTMTATRVSSVYLPGLDPTHIMTTGSMRRPFAVIYAQGAKSVAIPLNEAHRAGVELLEQKFGDLFPNVIDISRGPRQWLVMLHNSRVPMVYALFDSTTGGLTPITRGYGRELSESRLAPAELFGFNRRNGDRVSARLWRPADTQRPPLIVLAPNRMSDSPALDDFDPQIQALVALGYAVIRVNVRGTWGFGAEWRATGRANIAQMVTEDLEDAVKALVEKNVVDGKRVAVMGDGFAGVLALLVAKNSAQFAAVVGINMPARITRDHLLQISDSGAMNVLTARLGGWLQSGQIADEMSPVVVAPQVRVPAIYLFNEESLKGRLIEDGRYIQSAVEAAKAPAQFELAHRYAAKPVPPSVHSRESARMVIKIAEFLSRSMSGATITN